MSEEKNNHKLDLELLHSQCWYKKQWFSLRLSTMKVKKYLLSLFSERDTFYSTWHEKPFFYLKLILTAAICMSVLPHAPLFGVTLLGTTYDILMRNANRNTDTLDIYLLLATYFLLFIYVLTLLKFDVNYVSACTYNKYSQLKPNMERN